MARIYSLSIKNFRGIETFDQNFGNSNLVCLIGRGDSGKSTILEAISYVLSPSWNVTFYDTDFFNCIVDNPIVIEATLIDVPEKLLREEKFGLYIRGLTASGTLTDELENIETPTLTVRLEVKKDLEPNWTVTNGTTDIAISAENRSHFNTFILSDFLERHFSWTRGGPLLSILKRQGNIEFDNDDTILNALREAKLQIDKGAFSQFTSVSEIVATKAKEYGVTIDSFSTTVDIRDISVRDGKVCLHEAGIPLRLKGKGTKRLISAAIQTTLSENGGIVLIDEFEQGLEPDRVQHLAKHLKDNNKGQIFITTHSRDVVVQLTTSDLFLKKAGAPKLVTLPPSLQGCIRSNPEAFFAKRVIVCEGPTEIGICNALNSYRIEKGEANIAFKGVRFANGTGTTLVKYCEGFRQSDFPTCLFCDSDAKDVNDEKAKLTCAGVIIIDWSNNDCLELAIIKNVPLAALKEIYKLAVTIKSEESGDSYEEADKSLRDSLKAKLPTYPDVLSSETDSLLVRQTLGNVAKKNGWFKTQTKGEQLGEILFKHFDSIKDNELGQKLEELSNWIDK